MQKYHFIDCRTRATAVRRHPAAVKIIKVCGGYAAFYSLSDYETWRNQK